jgi:hypothetical protein
MTDYLPSTLPLEGASPDAAGLILLARCAGETYRAGEPIFITRDRKWTWDEKAAAKSAEEALASLKGIADKFCDIPGYAGTVYKGRTVTDTVRVFGKDGARALRKHASDIGRHATFSAMTRSEKREWIDRAFHLPYASEMQFGGKLKVAVIVLRITSGVGEYALREWTFYAQPISRSLTKDDVMKAGKEYASRNGSVCAEVECMHEYDGDHIEWAEDIDGVRKYLNSNQENKTI